MRKLDFFVKKLLSCVANDATSASYIQSVKTMDEQRLIAGYKRGDSQARREIYEMHAPAMMALCMRYLKNTDTAKDVFQDGFVKVFTNADQFSGKGSLGGWIRKIMVNTALEFLRKEKTIQWYDLDETFLQIDENQIDVDRLSENELIECIATLSDTYRTVFNLICIEGYSYAEVALKMDTNEGTVRTQYSRARKKLQAIILDKQK